MPLNKETKPNQIYIPAYLGREEIRNRRKYEYYLYNLFFGAWLTEICVFISFFQMFIFTFHKQGMNIDLESRIIFSK